MIRRTPEEKDQEVAAALCGASSRIGRLLEDAARGLGAGFEHTLREILQQPATWIETAQAVGQRAAQLRSGLGFDGGARPAGIVLTGSGSSQYAGDCAQPGLAGELGIPAWSIASGDILTEGASALPPVRPLLVVSLARSGDSPESAPALCAMLREAPGIRHLVITCNANGKLARLRAEHPEIEVVVLADRTNDRSLVMTSSFTNLALAARLLARLDRPQDMDGLAHELAARAQGVLLEGSESLARVAEKEFRQVVFLGSGERYGAARESALKMLEMTAGRVHTMTETYLGLRHGPMSAIHKDTLMVCFLSSDPVRRAYEGDLIRELHRKRLGHTRVVAGPVVPPELLLEGDVGVDFGPDAKADDASRALVYVLTGQLLAFFKCLAVGLKPDSPSETGVINRVVENFRIHMSA